MPFFTKINENIYSLEISDADAPVVLVRGKSNFLINCSSDDRTAAYTVIPALKKLGQSPKSIHGIIFTECSARTLGGAHRIRELIPGAKILAVGSQGDKLRNPAYYESIMYSVCPDHAPPTREIRGIFIDGEVDMKSRMFEELIPIPSPGHTDDSVCWYHTKTGTLICGENLQGNGSEQSGIAAISDATAYEESLSKLSELDINTLLCSSDIKEVPNLTHGKAQCLDVINRSLAISEEYGKFVHEYISNRRAQQQATTLEELTAAYFSSKGFKPQFQGQAMLTLHGYSELEV